MRTDRPVCLELHETKDRYLDGQTMTKGVTFTYLINVDYITSVHKLPQGGCQVEYEGNAGYRTRRIDADESYEKVSLMLEKAGVRVIRD